MIYEFFPNGDFYVGSVAGNVQHGYGTYVWSDGLIYQGDWWSGEPWEEGGFSWLSGSTFGREFKSGRIDGFGTFVASNGASFCGLGSSDGEHVYGKTVYAKRDYSKGTRKLNLQDGRGLYFWRNGNESEGERRNGTISGRGILPWANRFEGQRENGVLKVNKDMSRDGEFFFGEDGKEVCLMKDSLVLSMAMRKTSTLSAEGLGSRWSRAVAVVMNFLLRICTWESDDVAGDTIRVGETRVLSASCSSSISSDNEFSSSPNNVSPNTLDTRTITYWEKGQLLGRGSFGSVYEGIADVGFLFAIKEVSLHDQGAQESILQFEQEIALLSQFKHENIVRYYGTEKDELNLYIFLELVTKGSLLNLYHTYHLRDSQVSAYTRQILNGLKYLHDRNVVHRDIKCANILVDASGSVKLADFGLAKATRLNDVKSCKGTVFWMAPEVVGAKSNGYGLPADIWSLGCTVLEMLTRQFPYYPLELAQAVFRIGKGERPPVPDTLSADATDFILKCVRVNPDDRPTAAQLLGHPFVKLP